jgi:hypothetical protein
MVYCLCVTSFVHLIHFSARHHQTLPTSHPNDTDCRLLRTIILVLTSVKCSSVYRHESNQPNPMLIERLALWLWNRTFRFQISTHRPAAPCDVFGVFFSSLGKHWIVFQIRPMPPLISLPTITLYSTHPVALLGFLAPGESYQNDRPLTGITNLKTISQSFVEFSFDSAIYNLLSTEN